MSLEELVHQMGRSQELVTKSQDQALSGRAAELYFEVFEQWRPKLFAKGGNEEKSQSKPQACVSPTETRATSSASLHCFDFFVGQAIEFIHQRVNPTARSP